ncbi:MAG: hypothetical protein CBC24_06135 [Candidatus Pelagibacter sp. TMED64]|nr:hypothetical protein [Candidatus Pelagibacter sp.]OUU65009.1 MAG: hypothetical protein CBC24_06135 [Candidatus Pelagibacter sp. TMED64]|tara:strand:- start:11091 stop:11390 length:300 start_codon:yes stop_codon:yes gene_type:complete
MTKGYWVALYKKIENKDDLGSYALKATETIKNYGGKPLVRGGKYNCLEGDEYQRTVIWEFPSFAEAEKCYNSKEYQNAWSLAKNTTERNLQVIEGFSIE